MFFIEGIIITFTFFLVVVYFTYALLSRIDIDYLSNRTVFITGCDTGFGNLLARSLDARGVMVIAGCLSEKGATDLKQRTSTRLKTVLVDITDKESVEYAYDFTKHHVGGKGLWGVVNNAGIIQNFAPAEWTTVEDFQSECDVNLFGTISVTLTFLPLLRQSRGRLVNVCSVVANWGYPGLSNYVVSKAGVKMFTTCLRRELFNSGVTTHTIEPGGFNTNIANKDKFLSILNKAYLRSSMEKQTFYGGHIATYVVKTIKLFGIFINTKPQKVADAMTHALLAKYPKMSYTVGLDAILFFGLLSWLPEWIVDQLLGWPGPYGNLCLDLTESSLETT